MLSSIRSKFNLCFASSGDGRIWRPFSGLFLLPLILYGAKGFAFETSSQSLLSIKVAAQKFIEKIIEQEYPRHLIEIGNLDPRLKLSACDKPLDEFLAPGSNLPGNVTIGVHCTGSKAWTIYVTATVKGIRKMVITKHPLLENTAITLDDISSEERVISSNRNDYISNPEQVVGKITKHTLPASTALTLSMLSAPILVKRSQQVIILAETAGVEVRMPGTALMDGTSGQVIRVINALSKRIVEGTVIQPGIIKVNM